MSIEAKRRNVAPPPTSIIPSQGMDYGRTSSTVPTIVPEYKQNFFSNLSKQNGAKNGPVRSSGPMSGVTFSYKSPITETSSYQSKPYVHVTRQVKESRDNLLNFPTVRLPLFLQKDDPNRKPTDTDDCLYSILDPVTWNYLHRVNSAILNAKYQNDAYKLWENWTFQGFGQTDDQQTLKTYNQVYQNRAVVIAMQDYMIVTNSWGGDIRRGTKLFFILKQKVIPANTLYEIGFTRDDYRTISKTKNEADEYAFQLEPYAHWKHDFPPMSVLLYQTCDGETKRGVPIYVGISDDDASLNDLSNVHHCPNAMTSVRMLSQRGDLQITLRPNNYKG